MAPPLMITEIISARFNLCRIASICTTFLNMNEAKMSRCESQLSARILKLCHVDCALSIKKAEIGSLPF